MHSTHAGVCGLHVDPPRKGPESAQKSIKKRVCKKGSPGRPFWCTFLAKVEKRSPNGLQMEAQMGPIFVAESPPEEPEFYLVDFRAQGGQNGAKGLQNDAKSARKGAKMG